MTSTTAFDDIEPSPATFRNRVLDLWGNVVFVACSGVILCMYGCLVIKGWFTGKRGSEEDDEFAVMSDLPVPLGQETPTRLVARRPRSSGPRVLAGPPVAPMGKH